MSQTTEDEATPAQQEPELTAAELEADREEIVESIAWGD